MLMQSSLSQSGGICGIFSACSFRNSKLCKSNVQLKATRKKLWVQGSSLFDEEAIGANYGEGFSTFRPKGPLHVDVDYLNEKMRKTGLERIRLAMKPDESFGLIYSLDNVLADTQDLRFQSWKKLSLELGKSEAESLDKRLVFGLRFEDVIKNVLNWSSDPTEIQEMKLQINEIFKQLFLDACSPSPGLVDWLLTLRKTNIPCAVSSSLDRLTLLTVLQKMEIHQYFRSIVTKEDGMESLAHGFLSAAIKLDRPPCKCVVFEDDPRGITAAHNCSMKTIAIIGAYPAYELSQADLTVSSFEELSVINLRRLFSVKGSEFMDLQKTRDSKSPPKKRLSIDTFP